MGREAASAPAQDSGVRLSRHRTPCHCLSRHPTYQWLWGATVAIPSAHISSLWCPGLTQTPAFWQRGPGSPSPRAAAACSHICYPSARRNRCWQSGEAASQVGTGGLLPRGIPGCYSSARCKTAQALVSSHPKKFCWPGDDSSPCQRMPPCWEGSWPPAAGGEPAPFVGPQASTVGAGRFAGERN